jgi:immune inhibitor A
MARGHFVFRSNLGAASYPDSCRSYLTSPEFSLAGRARATLEFLYWHDFERGDDFMTVECSTDGGATWTTLSRTTGASPAYPSWRAALLELPTGSTRCRIRFGLESDEKANDYPGVGLDQVEVRADP